MPGRYPSITRLEADVCIVGGGPAGIAIATELAGYGGRIVLAESGGFATDVETQSLNAGETVGLSYRLSESRPRCFGGAGTHWAGNSRPIDDRIFGTRDWIPHSGWPFARSELDPYFGRARAFCGLPLGEPGVRKFVAAGGLPVAWSEPFETAIWQVSPIANFGETFRPALAKRTDLTVLLNATLLDLESGTDGNAISSARFGTLAGSRFTIDAKVYVLACGGIENARLLLAMASPHYPTGLGNRRDLVGRFFMEHPELQLGALVMNRRGPQGVPHTVPATAGSLAEGFRLSDAMQERSKTGDAAFWPLFATGVEAFSPPDGDMAFGPQIQDLSSRLAPVRPSGPRACTDVTISFEQSPDPESRVALAESRDAFGVPRVRLDWRLNDLDRRTFATAVSSLIRECGRQGVGRFWLRPPLRDLDLGRPESIRFDIPLGDGPTKANQLGTELRWGCHHMGTTRMDKDPHRGVVDDHCRVHGLANLYVAGSSVFPTAGMSNPTLTILALAMRLADHLEAKRQQIVIGSHALRRRRSGRSRYYVRLPMRRVEPRTAAGATGPPARICAFCAPLPPWLLAIQIVCRAPRVRWARTRTSSTLKPALRRRSANCSVRRRRPHGEDAARPERRSGGAQAAGVVEAVVRLAHQSFRAVVDVEEDRVESRPAPGDDAGDIAFADGDAGVAQASPEQLRHRAPRPRHDGGHHFGDEDARVRTELREGGAERETHSEAADEDPRLLDAADPARRTTSPALPPIRSNGCSSGRPVRA